jgi:hypothetical protein
MNIVEGCAVRTMTLKPCKISVCSAHPTCNITDTLNQWVIEMQDEKLSKHYIYRLICSD